MAVLEHELVHAKQFWRSLGLYALLYKLSKRHRLRYEVEAYHRQYLLAPLYIDFYSAWLAQCYGLDVTKGVARAMIKRGFA